MAVVGLVGLLLSGLSSKGAALGLLILVVCVRIGFVASATDLLADATAGLAALFAASAYLLLRPTRKRPWLAQVGASLVFVSYGLLASPTRGRAQTLTWPFQSQTSSSSMPPTWEDSS